MNTRRCKFFGAALVASVGMSGLAWGAAGHSGGGHTAGGHAMAGRAMSPAAHFSTAGRTGAFSTTKMASHPPVTLSRNYAHCDGFHHHHGSYVFYGGAAFFYPYWGYYDYPYTVYYDDAAYVYPPPEAMVETPYPSGKYSSDPELGPWERMGYDWGQRLRSGLVTRDELANYLNSAILKDRSAADRDAFKQGFLSSYGPEADSVWNQAWDAAQKIKP